MKNKVLLIICLLFSGACLWAEEGSSPMAVQNLQKALQPCPVSYSGRINVTHWTQSGTRSEDVRVWHRPPNLYRWEFLKPDGQVDRVLLTNGADERLDLVGGELSLRGRAAHGRPKQITSQKEWTLLLSNYHVRLLGEESVAGHLTHVLELDPRQAGKPIEKIWVDKNSGVILGVKRYLPDDPLVVLSRFIQFQVSPSDLDQIFEASVPDSSPHEMIDHGYNPDFLSPEEYLAQTGQHAQIPAHPPMGFQLESMDVFRADGHPIVHYRFTDGLSTVSVFRSDRPARFCQSPRRSIPFLSRSSQASNRSNRGGHIIQSRSGEAYLTLISDLSPRAMEDFMAGLK